MKHRRQRAILDLVSRSNVHTQTELAGALSQRGMRATQATVSRDIRELGLVRTPEGYLAGAGRDELITSFKLVEFLAVIHTPPGTANLVARRIDESQLPGVAGTVAGDDTVIAVLSDRKSGPTLRRFLLG